MQFRPCIDIRLGRVTQIVGSTLRTRDEGAASTNEATENFVSEKPASEFAKLYRDHALHGGHVIMLGASDDNESAATNALAAWPHGLQVGGGINQSNAKRWIDAGAAAVIVTSAIFTGGELDYDKLSDIVNTVGRDRLVIDLSCRRRATDSENYYVVTNQWQTFSSARIARELFESLKAYCCEFLVHGVDVEGKRQGIEEKLIERLSAIAEETGAVITYAGGVRDVEDLARVKRVGRDCIHVSVGSALDIFGGNLKFEDVVNFCRQ